jgi:poly(beta-D-mannuronate) lyase
MRLAVGLVLGCSWLGCSTLTGWAKPPGVAPPRPGLLSPWDMRQIVPTQVAYACPEPREIAPKISILSKDYRPSPTAPQAVLDAAYGESSQAVTDLATHVLRAADTYQRTGSLPAAQCAAEFLGAAAFDDAIAGQMPTEDEVYYSQTFGLRALAVGYLKIRNSGAIKPEEDARIQAWLVEIAVKQKDYYGGLVCRNPEKICHRFNQRGSSAAWAVASVGIAVNNPGLFGWGLARYREAVDHIDREGMVMQCHHGQYLLKFNLEVVAALVPLAEYGELNGEGMYDYDHGRIHELIRAVTRGMVDPSPFEGRVQAAQTLPSKFEGWEVGWAAIYVRRFPDPVIDGLLQQMNDKGLALWGGQPFGLEPGS